MMWCLSALSYAIVFYRSEMNTTDMACLVLTCILASMWSHRRRLVIRTPLSESPKMYADAEIMEPATLSVASETLDIIRNTKLISGKNPFGGALGRLPREMATATEARVRAPIRKWKLGRRHGRRLRRVPSSERPIWNGLGVRYR
jgi:hypothetical protein